MSIMMLGLYSCEKENIGEAGEGPALAERKAKPAFGAPCSTALMIQGMTPSSATCSVTDLVTLQNVVTFDNGTAYVTLMTNRDYFVDIQGSTSATFSWCSCGDNIGSTTIPAGGFTILSTSSSSSNYTICSF